MKYLKTFIAFSIIFPLINTTSCIDYDSTGDEDFECTPENTVYFPEDALARFYFMDGTYWIYKDSVAGTLDSIWVENSIIGIVKYDDENHNNYKKCYQEFGYDLISDLYGMSYIVTPSYGQKGINYSTETFGIDDMPNGVHSQAIYRVLLHGNNYDGTNDIGGKQIIIDSTFSNNNTYYNILRIYYPNQTYDYLLDAYYVKNVGLVKFRRRDGSTWELERYHIVQ